MYLTATNLAHYLLGRGLIDAESVVDGDLVIIEAGRRNRNFKVLRQNASGFFIKQVSNTQTWEPIVTLHREATFYELVRSGQEFRELTGLAPRLIDYNPANCSLVVDLVSEGENLTEYHARLGDFPEPVGANLGRRLAGYQSAPLPHAGSGAGAVFPRQIPWILGLASPQLAPIAQLGQAGTTMMTALQGYPALLWHLLALRSEWVFDSLLHGDMKWDNLVVSGGGGDPAVRIVDWELVDIGDAGWDVGAIFAAYVAYCLMIPAGLGQMSQLGGRDGIVRARPALRQFWTAYAQARGLAGLAARAYLERCMRFAAARLVLTVFEWLYNAHQMTPGLHAMLHTSQTMFQYPGQSADDLLGSEIAP
jgi:hypothetical protein